MVQGCRLVGKKWKETVSYISRIFRVFEKGCEDVSVIFTGRMCSVFHRRYEYLIEEAGDKIKRTQLASAAS